MCRARGFRRASYRFQRSRWHFRRRGINIGSFRIIHCDRGHRSTESSLVRVSEGRRAGGRVVGRRCLHTPPVAGGEPYNLRAHVPAVAWGRLAHDASPGRQSGRGCILRGSRTCNFQRRFFSNGWDYSITFLLSLLRRCGRGHTRHDRADGASRVGVAPGND